MGVYDINKVNNGIRFHMPGHCGAPIGIDTSMDITELSYSDNLQHPHAIIDETECKVADFYNSKYALIFTAGATSAISAVFTMLRQLGEERAVHLLGNTHKSVYNQAYINGFTIDGEQDDIIFNTSPDYYGKVNKLAVCGRINILDCSHGAHFPLHSDFPKIDIAKYDIIITSMHKTLPVLTGGACLITNNTDYRDRLMLARSITHTTSPSYMVMASIDSAMDILAKDGGAMYDKARKCVSAFIDKCKYKTYYNDDFTRLIIDFEGCCADDYRIYLESNGVFSELCQDDKIVLIITPFNAMYLETLLKLLNDCTIVTRRIIHNVLPQYEISDVRSSLVEMCEYSTSIGRIVCEEIGLYPPGVPIIIKGGIVNKAIIDFIDNNKDKIFGLINGKIAVYK